MLTISGMNPFPHLSVIVLTSGMQQRKMEYTVIYNTALQTKMAGCCMMLVMYDNYVENKGGNWSVNIKI